MYEQDRVFYEVLQLSELSVNVKKTELLNALLYKL